MAPVAPPANCSAGMIDASGNHTASFTKCVNTHGCMHAATWRIRNRWVCVAACVYARAWSLIVSLLDLPALPCRLPLDASACCLMLPQLKLDQVYTE